MKYDVFISFKNTDENGMITEDAKIANDLFEEFSKKNINAFFSNVRLFESGEASYKEAIEKALDDARVMIVLSTKAEYLSSKWVAYERESFHNDILSGRKRDAVLVPYLKSMDGMLIPRSLRNYETFTIEKDSISSIVDFVMNFLNKNKSTVEKKVDKSLTTGKQSSSYDPSFKKELKRLKIQAKNTRNADMPAINYALERLKKDRIYILDAGCAYGYVTFDRFNDIQNALTIGVDINQKCLECARKSNPIDNIIYEYLPFEDEDFEERIEAIMEKYQIPSFDIIFSSLVIHHLKNPNKFLRRIRKYLSDDGFIILRGSDDGSIMTYNDDGLIKEIVDLTINTEGISDRFNGRKIYSQLVSSGYTDVKMMNYIKDISDFDFDERNDAFVERFSYRRNYLQNALDQDPCNAKKSNDLDAMDTALAKLENKFTDESFWYCETDFVGVARKKKNRRY